MLDSFGEVGNYERVDKPNEGLAHESFSSTDEAIMIRRVVLSGFRGFKKLSVGPFYRVNLIVGRNNVGKTTLLESLFLMAGPTNPSLPLTLSHLRGIDQFRNDPGEVWGWLFHRKDIGQKIELSSELPNGKTRTLILSMVDATSIGLSSKKRKIIRSMLTASSGDKPISLEMRYRDDKEIFVNTASLAESKIEFKHDRTLRVPTSILITGRSGNPTENAERYSKLEEVGHERDVLGSLKRIEPRLKRMAVLVTGSGPIVHCDIDIGHMVPMNYMGDGIGRLLTILLSIADSAKGMVLIDEVEMGFHYSAMVEAWKAIQEMARYYDVQIVATTHNWECIQAAYAVFSAEDEPNFVMHRLDRRDDEEIESTTYTLKMIETALASGLEVR